MMAEGDEPEGDLVRSALNGMVKDYPSVCPYRCVQEGDGPNANQVEGMFAELIPGSSPGLPFAQIAVTNKDLIDKFRHHVVDAVMERFAKLVSVDLRSEKIEDPVELVKQGFCDPVRVFIKNEPHTMEKIEAGRLRLISSVSVVDQIVERFLFGPQNRKEIEQWLSCPSKPGMGLNDDDQCKEIYAMVKQYIDELCEADVQAWDWNVKKWMLETEAERRVILAGVEPDSLYARLVRNRFFCLSRKVFALSDGRMYAQRKPGIMASGSYATSSSNSGMNVHLMKMLGARIAWAMGDDSLNTGIENAVEKYKKYGFKLKMYRRCNEDGRRTFEFCSHEFDGDKAIPLNVNKCTFRLLSSLVDKQGRYAQWSHDQRHSTLVNEYDPVVRRVWLERDKPVQELVTSL